MIWQFIFSIFFSLLHLRFVQFNDYGKITVRLPETKNGAPDFFQHCFHHFWMISTDYCALVSTVYAL